MGPSTGASASRPSGFRARLGWLTLFAAAFGFVEAMVVVYLRAVFYPDGFRFPIVVLGPDDPFTVSEVAREAATLLMLLGAAALAARGFWGRFGAFAYAFGVWDIVYYLGLEAVLGWPDSLATWDVLFLIPGIWTGPVWSAAAVAVLLTVCGAMMMRDATRGHEPRLARRHWALGMVSLVLLLAAFLWNHGPVFRGEMHGAFPWPLWLAGVAVGLGTFWDARRGRAAARTPGPGHSGTPR